jgi:hypothetical protein
MNTRMPLPVKDGFVMKRFPEARPAALCLARVLLLLCTFASASHARIVRFEEGSTCHVCHGKETVTHAGSVHGRFDVSCVDCHGGDDTQILWTAAMNPAAGFQGRFGPEETLSMCAGCHSDYEKMRQFGLPVDQLIQYKSSEHGKALFQTGNKSVAVCTSCHGIHDILEVKNPRASVYPTNAPDMCAGCHENRKLMKPLGVSATVVADYRKGQHGRRLLEKDLAAPSCPTCHGAHSAAPPGVAEVVNVCGQCHGNIRDQFKRSVHYRERLECISCHGSHNNEPPSTAMFTSARPGGCRNCHTEPESRAAVFIRDTLSHLSKARKDLSAAEKAAERAAREGFYVESEQVLLKEAHTALMEFRNTQHSLDMPDTDAQLATVSSKASHVMDNIKAKNERIIDRRIVMVAVAGYMLALLLMLFIKYRRLKKAHSEAQAQHDA